jgi:L-threonylcarbamoyladenylate synthase
LRPPAPRPAIRQAVASLARGGVIAYPTEAVWGLGCDPTDGLAVQRLLALKNRPVEKGLILVADSEARFEPLLRQLNIGQRARLALSWPGPNTWLVPHHNLIPPWIHGDHETVALRVSAHPLVSALCAAWGGPLVSTSANRANQPAATAQHQVRRIFGNELDFILPGALGSSSTPSTIRDLLTDKLVRA